MTNKFVIKVASSMLLAASLLAGACNNDEAVMSFDNEITSHFIERKSHLSFENIHAMVSALRPQTRATESEEYVFITDEEVGDTLFYVVNYPEGGWTMYASDKRVPAVVAENAYGRFVLREIEKVMGAWFDTMKEDMKAVKKAEDKDLNFTAEEIDANKNAWDAVCDPDGYLAKNKGLTRGHGEPIDPNKPHGHYELYNIYTWIEDYDTIPHLMETQWDQVYPYNKYCPDKVTPDSYGTKCYAGCVAIAGAQMLYYLHYKIGLPEIIPDTAYCYGDHTVIPRNWAQWYNGSDIWGKMASNHGNSYHGRHAAPLIADIGRRVNMQYSDIGSFAATSSLVDSVFAPYGIGCLLALFSASLVNNSLLAEMPVIVQAKATEGSLHSFIIDAYKRTRYVTEEIYQWIPDPGYEHTIFPADMSIKTYSNPQIAYYKMNWGNPMGGYSETWCVSTGSWLAPNGHHFDLNRYIIYNFHGLI